MPGWKDVLLRTVTDAEARFDALKQRLDQRFGGERVVVTPFRGFGDDKRLVLRGRVLEDTGDLRAGDRDSIWANLLNTYHRFATDEVAGAHVLAQFGGAEQELTADDEGFFEATLPYTATLPTDRAWHDVALTLLAPQPKGQPAQFVGQVFVPQPAAQFGVISDIDDTVVKTDATHLLRAARGVFLGNARTRLPFSGVSGLYRALHAGADGPFVNPLFYISSSPWNLYDLLDEFFQLNRIPPGAMFLRDWGISRAELLPTGHHEHKLRCIRQVMEFYPHMPFVLLGDSGQEDPEIYAEAVRRYPGRVLAVYIRNVSPEPDRAAAIRALADEVLAAGSALVLAEDTLAIARHAAENGWIEPRTLDNIAAENAADQGNLDVGQMLDDEPPTVSISEQTDTDAVEGAIEHADDRPAQTIKVEGNE